MVFANATPGALTLVVPLALLLSCWRPRGTSSIATRDRRARRRGAACGLAALGAATALSRVSGAAAARSRPSQACAATSPGRPRPAARPQSTSPTTRRRFALSSERGHVVVLTFLDSRCRALCPLQSRMLAAGRSLAARRRPARRRRRQRRPCRRHPGERPPRRSASCAGRAVSPGSSARAPGSRASGRPTACR